MKQTEKIIKTTVLNNFSLAQIESVIQKLETGIAANIAILEKQKEPLEEAKQHYLSIKNDYDSVEQELEVDQLTLKTFVNLRNGGKQKDIRVLRQTSNLDKKPKSLKRIDWKIAIIQALEVYGKFVTTDDLFELLLMLPKEEENNSLIKQNNETKLKFKNALAKYLVKYHDNSGTIVNFKSKIGLNKWTDPNNSNKPLPIYMKEFVYES